jgi:hypothetical protein
MFVFGNNGQIFDQPLCNDNPIKGVPVVQIKGCHPDQVVKSYLQHFKVIFG